MTRDALQRYQVRMLRVLDHIDQHLEDDLSIETLCSVAAFSRFHFHRQFSALFGLPVQRYVQLARMKRASYRLAFRDGANITHIALDAGYDAPDAFARAFRKRVGQSPSDFRKLPDWEPWLAAFGPYDNARSKLMNTDFSTQDVRIDDVPDIAVAVMEHRGPPSTIHASIQRFIAWRKANRLGPRVSATYNVFHNDPRTAAPAEYRLDFCAVVTREFDAYDAEMQPGLIPGGRCAILRVTGQADNLEPAALYLYREWLPESGEELRDFPIFCQRVSFFPDVPEHEAVTDLFLPLK